MKITYDVVNENQKTMYIGAHHDVPQDAPGRALVIAREVEKLFSAYPSYSVINIQIEKDEDDATTTEANVQEPPESERSSQR
jgi:hypothetical protein